VSDDQAKLRELREQIYLIPFIELEPHLKRGGVILVDEGLDLAETGLLLARDDKAAVAKLVEEHRLMKAFPLELETWRREKRFFNILIVQPFVLAQHFVSLAPQAAN